MRRIEELTERYAAHRDTIALAAGDYAAAWAHDMPVEAECLANLREKIGVTGLVAELAKKDAERKLMHEMLNEAGIPTESAGAGEGICLIGRLAVLIERNRKVGAVASGREETTGQTAPGESEEWDWTTLREG